jgi:hypothetical protein
LPAVGVREGAQDLVEVDLHARQSFGISRNVNAAIGAWCTLRNDFRNFRIDRVRDARLGDEPFGRRRVILLKDWEAIWA